MKNIYLITTTLILFLAFSTVGFSNSSSDADYITSEFAKGRKLNSLHFEPFKTTFKALDVSGFTSSQQLFINRAQTKTHKQETHVLLNGWLNYQASPTSTISSINLVIEEFNGLYECSATVTISSDAVDNTICAGTSVTFTAEPVNGGSDPKYQWQLNGENVGTNSSVNSFTPTKPLLNGQVVSVVLTSDIADCGAAKTVSDYLTMTVNAIPSITGTIPGSVCGAGTVDLEATASAGTINWYADLTGGSSLGTGTTFKTPSISSDTTYYVDATSNGCTTGSRTAVLATVNAIPTIIDTVPASRCGPGTVSLGATASEGTINWYTNLSGGSSLGTGTTFTTPSISSDTTYYVDATSNGCTTGSRTAVLATVNVIPTISGTTPASRCGTGTVDLGATASEGTINWYAALTGGPSLGTGTTFTTPSISSNTTYYVDATENGCTTGSRTAVLATVFPIPTITGTTPGTTCGTGPVSLSATASTGTINWYAASTGGASLGTGTTFTTPSISSDTTYFVDATSNGCTTGLRTAVLATVNTIPTITGTTPASRCGAGTVGLSATASAGTINWYAVSTGGSSLGTGTTFTTPSIASNTTYYVDATMNGCTTGLRTAILATVNAIPTITGTTPGNVCVSGTTTLSATASTGTINWYAASTGGTSLATGTSFTTPSISSTTTYYVDSTSNGCTTGTRTAVTATVNAIPTITSKTPGSRCGNGSVALSATASAGTINWYANPTGGAILGTGTSFTTPSINATRTYYVDAIIGGCTTRSRTAIDAIIYPGNPTTGSGNSPGARITSNNSGSICPSPTTTGITFTAPISSQYVENYSWNLPPGFIITSGEGTNQITVSVLGPGAIRANNQIINVTVTNPCDSSTSQNFTVNVGSFAAVDTGSDFSMCVGTNPTLINTLSGNAATVTWAITSGSGTISGGPYPTPFVYTPDVAAIALGSVTLRATTNTASGNCSSSVGIDDVTITIKRSSVAPTGIVASIATICKGESTTLTQTGGSLGTGASWKWYSNSGFTTLVGTSNAADASLSVSPIANTTYYLRSESTTGAPCAANIAAPGSVTVTVNQPSVAPTSIGASTVAICNGGSTTLTQTGGSLGTGASWKWYSDNTYTTAVGTGTGSNASLPVSPTATTTYYLRAESTTGAPCTADVAAVGSVTVTVNQPSVVPTSIVASTATICNGGSTTLSQTGGSLGTGASWKWYSNSGFTTLVGTSNAADASLSVSPTATTTYYLRVESTSGAPCTANIAAPGSVTVTVNQSSVAPTSIGASIATICNGSSTTLTQTGGSLGTGASWKWYSDNTYTTSVGTGTGSNARLSVSPTATTTYYLRAESTSTPCTADVAAAGSVTVTVNQPSVVPTSIVASTATICNVGSTTLTQTGGSLGTGASWKWYSNSSFTTLVDTNNSADASLSVSPTATTTYYLRAESTTGAPCTANIAAPGSVTVTVNQPVVINTQPNPSQTVCSGFPVSLSVTATGTGLTYEWFKNGTTTGISSATLNITNAALSDAGTYTVVVKGAAPCGNVISNNAIINVNQNIEITSQPTAQVICEGNNSSLSVTATGTGLSYQWRKGGVPISNSGTISGVTTNTLTFTGASTNNTGSYDVVISAIGGTCSQTISNSTTLTVTPLPAATISYAGTPFCSDSGIQTVTRTGTPGGTYSATAGLTINASTGTITPSTSTAGSYTVTYTMAAAGGCTEQTATTSVTITAKPIASISYSATNAFCETDPNTYNVNLSGSNNAGGTYSISPPTGLTMTSDGQISPNGATVGTYTIRYEVPSSNGCPIVPATVNVTIQAKPAATISYSGTPFCSDSGTKSVTFTGATGGTYSAPSGLTINSSTGAITTSTSIAGTYTVTYTMAAAAGCTQQTATTSVTITTKPTASISYANAAYCETDTANIPVIFNGSTGGTFTATPAGLSINSVTGQITANNSAINTYTVTYSVAAADGCDQVTATTIVNISALPKATFTYNASTYCKATGVANPILSYTGGGVGGNFTSSPAGLTLNASTGAITLASSTAGTFIITNTIPATGGCDIVQASQTITIFSETTGGSLTGFTLDKPLEISNNILACHEGNGTLNLTGQSGAVLRWESSTNGGQSWTSIPNTTDSYNFSGVTSTTLFRAVLESGPCGPKNSAIAIVNVIPSHIKPTVTPNSLQTICFGSSVNYTSTSGFGTGQLLQGAGDFNSSNPKGWLVDGIEKINASGNNASPGPWVGTGTNTFHDYTYNSNDKKFLIANGNYNSILESPTFNTFGLTTSTLEFFQAYDLKVGARAIIELSLDGGLSYNITLSSISGPVNSGRHNNGFNRTIIDLQNYIGQANLKIRFRYIGTASSAWAIDKFKVPDTRVNETIEFVGAGITPLGDGRFNYNPITPGITTISVTSNLNGCKSTGDGTTSLSVAANFAYAGKPITPVIGECGVATVNLNAYDNTLTAAQNIENGAHDNNYITGTNPGTGAVGKWTITGAPSACGVAPSFSDPNSPRSTFSGGGAGTYTLTWTVAGCSSNVTVTLEDCSVVNFDGIDDYATFGDAFNRGANFSLEAWVKPNSITRNQTILSKRNANNNATGYDLSLDNATLVFNWNGTGTMTSPYLLTTSRWYHVAVTFGGDNYQLYIDGISVATAPGATAPVTNTSQFLLGAMDQANSPPNKPVRHFNGYIEELRIWNTTITQDQIRQMMNQRITNNGTAVAGEVVPLNITGINWSDLAGYYRMDVSCGGLVNRPGDVVGKLRNMNATNQPNSAPLPYVTQAPGSWDNPSIWLNGSVQKTPSSVGIDGDTPVNWNIVRIGHNLIATGQNITVSGLLLDANRFTIQHSNPNDGQSLEVTEYLNLSNNAVLKLVGESQLLQKTESSTVGIGTGTLERDQQGTGNMFNYNYWGSPVSSNTSAGASYKLSDVLYDGNSKVIWTTDRNGSAGSPITLSSRWLYIYDNNPEGVYEDWQRITQDTDIKTGLGFLMKGGGAPSAVDKNYTFKGSPNNGRITIPIGGGNQATLVGNPYPSAIDANKFIDDNEKVLSPTVTLQFWEQSPFSSTHILAQYEGGYAHYTKSGAVIGMVPPRIAGSRGISKKPTQFIPVGQGFFVSGSAIGGDIRFMNSQREFKKEINSESVFLRGTNTNSQNTQIKEIASNQNDLQRVRLAFKNPEGAIRHLLLAFTPDNAATDGIDYGYDGLNGDDFPNDLSFAIAGKKFVIQGVGEFDVNKKYPLDMTLKVKGAIEIALTELENFEAPIDIFIHDALLNTYTKINDVSFQLQLEKGNYTGRFSLVFKPDSTLSTIDQDFKEIQVKYLQKTDEIYVKTPASIEVRQVYLINMAGQAVKSWNMTNMNFGQEFKIPVKNISEGNYILKVETTTNSYNKKMVIKFK